ncbi:MAG TPA: tetratricopeptide repeat protein [Bacteroidia bacterium]|jgi:tetratricopeptide (TPR) repeat protein
MKVLRLIFFFSLAGPAFSPLKAQSHMVDSIFSRSLVQATDTGKINELLKASMYAKMEGSFLRAIELAQRSLRLSDSIHWVKGSGTSHLYEGTAFQAQGDYTNGLSHLLKALHIFESIGDKKMTALTRLNIGLVYYSALQYDKAEQMIRAAMLSFTALADKNYIASCYSSLGDVYEKLGKYYDALANYRMALQLKQDVGQAFGIGNNQCKIGNILDDIGDHKQALEYFQRSLEYSVKHDLGWLVMVNKANIGNNYRLQKKYRESEQWLLAALRSVDSAAYLDGEKEVCANLSDIYASTNRYRQSLEYYKRSIAARDSLTNEENTKKTIQAQMQYEFDKKESEARAEQEKKDALAAADARKQKIILWSVMGGLLLVIAFAVFIYRSFLEKQKVNVEIGRQKHVIEEKQKEILDSIHYAKRIQRSLLPRENYIQRKLEKT